MHLIGTCIPFMLRRIEPIKLIIGIHNKKLIVSATQLFVVGVARQIHNQISEQTKSQSDLFARLNLADISCYLFCFDSRHGRLMRTPHSPQRVDRYSGIRVGKARCRAPVGKGEKGKGGTCFAVTPLSIKHLLRFPFPRLDPVFFLVPLSPGPLVIPKPWR